MLQSRKRPIALLCALVMCLGLLSGIVLPQIAQTASAVADPYARIEAKSTDEDGVITPKDNVYFLNFSTTTGNQYWNTQAPAANEGDEFTVMYGDSATNPTWGNGKTYRLQWKVNAFGTWADFMATLRGINPDEKNNLVVVMFPGSVWSISTNGNNDDAMTMTSPSAADPTEAELLNAYFLGPQAGKSPVTEKGSNVVANGRSIDETREFVFRSTFWPPMNGAWHFDGVAGGANLKFFVTSSASATAKSALYMDNLYAEVGGGSVQLFGIGGNNKTNGKNMKFEVTNSYFNQTGTDATSQAPVIQSNKTVFDNVVFNNFKLSTTDQHSQNQHIKLSPMAQANSSSAFMGDDAGKYSAVIKNCTFYDWQSSHVWRSSLSLFDEYGANASITFDSNFYGGEKGPVNLCDLLYLDKVSTAPSKASKLIFTNNEINVPKSSTDAAQWRAITANGSVANSIDMKIRDNIFRLDYDSAKQPVVFYSFAGFADVSGNLFVDLDGNVRTEVNSYDSDSLATNYTVATDIYASDELSGGVKEFFTVQDTDQDLSVAYCNIKLSRANSETETSPYIQAAVTVVPKDGVVYNTANLFKFRQEGVKLVGFYSDAACTNAISTLQKGFGTAYALATYKTANTTCTVRYTVSEPTTYRVVAPNGDVSFDFNGDTLTDGDNATFYATLTEAYNAVATPSRITANPATDVIVLMPGTYSEALTLAKSVAILGPKFGVSAHEKGTMTVAGGRSTDEAEEAVLTAALTINTWNNVYVSMDGLAVNSSNLTAAQSTAVRKSYIALRNMNFASGTKVLTSTNASTTSAGQLYFSAYNSAFEASDGNAIYAVFAGVRIEDCLVRTAKNLLYARPLVPSNITYSPRSNEMYIVNNTFADTMVNNYCVAFSTYGGYANGNQFYKDGYKAIVDNNIVSLPAGKTFFRAMPFAKDTYSVAFTNNVVTFTGDGTGKAMDTYTTGTGASTDYKDIDVSGNIITNSSYPFNFATFGSTIATKNNVDVNDNVYYKLVNGEKVARKITTNATVSKNDTYYLNDAKTVTNEDMNLLAGGFDSVDMDAFDSWTARLSGSKASYSVSDFKAEKASVVGLYADQGCATEKASLAKGETAYLKLSYQGVTAVWEVSIASVWAKYGLEPASASDVVDVSTTEGEYMFIAPDWAAFAKATPDGALIGATPEVGDIFYATMPTTGYTYKLQYGVNAANVQNINTGLFATIVAFPGAYTNGSGYSATGTVTNNGVKSARGYTATAAKGAYGVGHNTAQAVNFSEFTVLGPYAGVPAGDTETGANLRADAQYEAVFSGSSFYVMNRTLTQGVTTTFDGIAGTAGIYFAAHWGNADKFGKETNSVSYTIKNAKFTDLTAGTFFNFYANNSSVGSNAAKNLAKADVTLNIEGSYFAWPDGSAAKLGNMNTDQIHVDSSVFIRRSGTTTSDNGGNMGFYINPVQPSNNADASIKYSYTLTNSYIDMPNSYFYGIYWNSTTGVNASTRAGYEAIIDNNIIIDAAQHTSNSSRANIYIEFSGSKAISEITDYQFTNNTFKNTTGAYPDKYGTVLWMGSSNAVRSADISGNTFIGYRRLFVNTPTGVDLKDNLFFDLDGQTPIRGKFNSGSASDTMLGDFTHKTSDFTVTGIAGATADVAVSTPAGEPINMTAEIPVNMKAGLTPATLGMTFVSDKVALQGIYEDADLLQEATSFTIGKTYYALAGYNDGNAATAVYTLNILEDLTGIDVYTGSKTYFDPDVAAYSDGMQVKRTVLEGESFTAHDYVFTVGENIFAVPSDIPEDSSGVRHLYLFAKEYTKDIPVSGSATERGLSFYVHGVKENVSPITLDNDGIPTATRAAARTNDAQESIVSGSITSGCQSNVVVNGVAFAGESGNGKVFCSSGSVTGYTTVEVSVLNCISANDKPLASTQFNGIITGKGNVDHYGTISNNHFINSENVKGHNLLMFRGVSNIEIKENYVAANCDDDQTTIWLSPVDSNYARNTAATFNANIHHNNFEKNITFNTLGQVDSADLKVNNNRFTQNANHAVKFLDIEVNNKNIVTNYDQTSIEIKGNFFEKKNSIDRSGVIFLGQASEVGEFAKFDISGNTFDNSLGTIDYAIENMTNYTIPVGDNTFIGFKYNFGDDKILDGGIVAIDPTTVTIPATAIFNGQVANYEEAGVTLANTMVSGTGAVDEGTLTAYDVCTAGNYVFNVTDHMMVKASMDDGTVYYNAVPLGEGMTAFTAQLTTADGTPVGNAYTVKIVKELLAVKVNDTSSMTEMDASAPDYNTDKPYAAYFEGQITASSTYLSDFVNNVDMKILDYGMYYGNDMDAMTNLDGYVGGVYTKDSKKVGEQKSYAADTNGLDKVYQTYSFRFKFIAPNKYRYGKMYLTYSVAGQTYTVYSDVCTLYSGTIGE